MTIIVWNQSFRSYHQRKQKYKCFVLIFFVEMSLGWVTSNSARFFISLIIPVKVTFLNKNGKAATCFLLLLDLGEFWRALGIWVYNSFCKLLIRFLLTLFFLAQFSQKFFLASKVNQNQPYQTVIYHERRNLNQKGV